MGGGASSTFRFFDERCRYVQKSIKRAAKDNNDDLDFYPGPGKTDYNINPAAEDYPFENVVLDGGGIKAIAYLGVIQALEDANILKTIDRFAGSSMGAYVAMLLALECTKEEIEKVLMRSPRAMYESSACCIPCNLLSDYGWHSFQNEYEYMGKIIQDKLGDKDATFLDLYRKKRKELCVVVTNVSHKEEEYMHVKTTPLMPMREAVRMSTSYPGFFQPVVYQLNGIETYMVDGGVISNYPVHCFDGWWLSMKKEDSFFNMLREFYDVPVVVGKLERFKLRQQDKGKTVGFALYNDCDHDIFKSFFEHDPGYSTVTYPDTPLGRKGKQNQRLKKEESTVKESFRRLIEAMRKRDIDENKSIPIPTLRDILNDEKFTTHHRETLFGKGVAVEDILKRFDTHNSGWTNERFAKLLEGIGFDILHGKYLGEANTIDDAFSYGSSVLQAVTRTCDRLYLKEEDLHRTVGINTHHIGTFSVDIKKEDKDFIIQKAYDATMDFLKKYTYEEKNTNSMTSRAR